MTDDQEKFLTFTIDESVEGMRLDAFLSASISSLSRSQLQKLLQNEDVFINGTNCKKRYKIKSGDIIRVRQRSVMSVENPQLDPEDIPLTILYEDTSILVINKPPGLVVHPGSGNKRGTLVNGLRFYTQDLATGFSPDRPGLVHRLDKETSGVIVVAKTNEAHAMLAKQFSNRQVEKIYYGFCVGVSPSSNHDIIELPLGPHKSLPTKRAVRKDGKPASTEFWVRAHQSGISFIKFHLHTGRTHQIRVHCAAKEFPILCDSVYGKGREEILKIQPVERPFAYKVLKCFSRHALHAYSLTIMHPVNKEMVTFTAPFPEDFARAITIFSTESGNTLSL